MISKSAGTTPVYRRTAFVVSVTAAVALAALTGVAQAATAQKPPASKASAGWVGTWANSPQLGITSATCPAGSGGVVNATVRNIVYTSVGGNRVRIRLTNAYGTAPVTVGSASVAIDESGAATVPASTRSLRFDGRKSVTIPAGVEVLSDPVHLTVRPQEDLAVSVYVAKSSGPATEHATAVQDNFVSTAGDHSRTSSAKPYTTPIDCWMFADGVDVPRSKSVTGSVVAFGDSITDGFRSGTNANDRWPNVLSRRLQAANIPLSVVDEGISGNQLLTDNTCCGDSGLRRLDRDVLTQPSVKAVVMLIGINDIGFSDLGLDNPPATPAKIIAGYKQVIARVHDVGLKIYASPLTPFLYQPIPTTGYQSAYGEKLREAVNKWIRTSHAFDGIVDFDKVLRSPRNPKFMKPIYDSGDHLHPNDAGYTAMGDAVPLRWFASRHG